MNSRDTSFQMQISRDRKRLQDPYAHLVEDGEFDATRPQMSQVNESSERVGEGTTLSTHIESNSNTLASEISAIRSQPEIVLPSVLKGSHEDERVPRKSIETIVRALQIQLWEHRSTLFSHTEEIDPLDVLDPFVALRGIGFQAELVETLGEYQCNGELFEIAGIIDTHDKCVRISRQLPRPIRNFTAAHELGHAVLHEGMGLHRDRPLDGSRSGYERDPMEKDADLFAGCFLIPRRSARNAFKEAFRTRQFEINEETAFAMNFGNADEFRSSCRSIRDLSRRLASAETYGGHSFNSLAVQFRVSVEAMAIRLEELKLVRFP